jgi:hypothetical protein
MSKLKSEKNRFKISSFYELIKKISVSRLLFSTVFSIAFFYMTKVVFLGFTFNENYMEKFYFSDYKILLIWIPVFYGILYLIEKYYNKAIAYVVGFDNSRYIKKFCIYSFILMFGIYLLYFLTFYPGGVYTDTWVSLQMLTGETEMTLQQPVLYTLMLNIVKVFIPDYYTGFAVFTAIQAIAMISILTYFIYWLLKKGLNPIMAFFITFFFMFFKLYPLYSVSVWKDTPFSLVLFLFTLSIIDLIFEFNENKIKISSIVKINILSILLVFLRNNGLYIIVFTVFVLSICFIKKIIKEKVENFKGFVISIITTIVICIIIEHVLVFAGFQKVSKIESLAIPIQQVLRVVAVGGNITESQKELIEKVMPEERIKERYRALLVDKIKWDDDYFDKEYLLDNYSTYFKLWLELLVQNPDEYFIAYLLETSGFWTFNVVGQEAYHSAFTWETLDDIILNINVIADNTNFDFRESMLNVAYYSGGFFFWITALSAFLTYRLCEKKYLIGYIAPISLWLTVMIATPMGQALRYVYILVLILPLNLLYPALMKKLPKKIENKK